MYTVKNGDTLYSIARIYNTSVDEIKKINYLTNNNLYVGQVLRIPEFYFDMDNMELPNYKTYVVKKGDTLYSIARENNIDVNTLIKDNALTSNTLKVGASLKIRIPADTSLVVEECIGPDYTPPTNFQNASTYTVKAGDNLYSIAKKFNTSVSNLISLNGLKSNSLSIGQQLKVPASGNSSTTNQTYIVKSGDSLYSIAKKFNTTVDSIKKKNNMSSNLLSIGQKLII
jgi:LysM repeat protein